MTRAELREQSGRLIHESWSRTKRAQGFHGPDEPCILEADERCIESYSGTGNLSWVRCTKFHADLIPWAQLPQKQKGINMHAFDDVWPLIDRYVAERDQAVLPLVKAVVERHRDFPSEGTSANFDGPYEYSVRIRLSSDTLEAAQRWLAERVQAEAQK